MPPSVYSSSLPNMFTPLNPTTPNHGPIFVSMDLSDTSNPYAGTDHHIIANISSAEDDQPYSGASDREGARIIRVACIGDNDANCNTPVNVALIKGSPDSIPLGTGPVVTSVTHTNRTSEERTGKPWGTSGWTPSHDEGKSLRDGPFYSLMVDADGYYNASWAFDVQTCYWDREGQPGCGVDEGLSGGQIAGAVMGSVVGGLIVFGDAGWFAWRKFRRRRVGYKKGKKGGEAVKLSG